MSVLFEIEYVNNTWGFRHTGTLILTDGTISKYDLSNTHKYTSSLITKIGQSQSVGRLDNQEISDLKNLLTQLPPQELPAPTAFDSGSTNYYGYLPNRKIHLAQEGHYIGNYNNRYSQLLASKLTTIVNRYL